MATPALVPDDSVVSLTAQAPSQPNQRRVSSKASPLWIHVTLLVVTLLSTTVVGMRYMDNFHRGHFPLASDADIFPYRWVWANLSHFAQGLPFSLTLLGILLTHEFGHYFACRSCDVKATLPYLLPAPSLSGTAGAIIRLQSRVRSRKALLTIGGMGPLCGCVVAIGCCVVGLACSRSMLAEPQHLVHLERPLLLRALVYALGPALHLQRGAPLLWHPVLVASWIGLLITSLNLIPAGQLDGGHLIYALSPKLHRVITRVSMLTLVLLAIFAWLGWLLWFGLLLLPGMRHPRLESTDTLTLRHKLLATSGLAMFLLCFMPQPFGDSSLLSVLHRFHR